MFNVFKEERRRAHERLIKESPEEIARKQARRQARRDKYAAKQKERLNQWISKLRSYPELIGGECLQIVLYVLVHIDHSLCLVRTNSAIYIRA